MRNLFLAVLSIFLSVATAEAKITFVTDYQDNPNLEFASDADKGPKNDAYYCQNNGYKLLTCVDPYKANTVCPRDSRYADACVCKPEYSQLCPEEKGLRGMGKSCDGKYRNCCQYTCRNQHASLIPCEQQGYEEIQSEREDSGCGQTCYVCSRKRI